MNRTITSLIVVCALAWCAQGAENIALPSGTSFENQKPGPFDPTLTDEGASTGYTYWAPTSDTNGLTVVKYAEGDAAYDYAAKGMTRDDFFKAEGSNQKYLGVDVGDPLERCIVRTSGGAVSNVLLTSALYADTLVRFTVSDCAPAITNTDRIVVWMRERAEGATMVTNLMITAGYYAGDFNTIEARDYVLTNRLEEGVWCRLTIGAITNITDYTRGKAGRETGYPSVPGFAVYIDGKPAAVDPDDDYAIGRDYRDDLLTSEARFLIRERRLFPWLVPSVLDEARTLSRVSFSGVGAADDVLFTAAKPVYDTGGSLFTLEWNYGVLEMECTVSNATSVTTHRIVTSDIPSHRIDYSLGTNLFARITVTNVVYDTARSYTNGTWTATNDCILTEARDTSGVFVYDGRKANPIGRVAANCPSVGVGIGAAYTTFAEAKEKAKAEGIKQINLESDLVITTGGTPSDGGVLSISEGDDFVLNLKGHTLRGRGYGLKPWTIYQTGGTLTIIDTEGSGAVLPPEGKTGVIRSWRGEEKNHPKLIIEAGRYAGEVLITGSLDKGLSAECAIGGGSFTNSTGETQFYLEQYVTNTSLYYALDADDYWSVALSDAFIWTGEGKDAKWTTSANWKGGKVPGKDDTAVFPRAEDGIAWDVDFGTGVATKRLRMDGDIAISGTNVFSDVTVEGSGRFSGSGMLAFTNSLPDSLTDEAGANGVRIDTNGNWKGTVKLSKMTQRRVLSALEGWGVAGSKVEFAGVRGYVSDRKNHALPYELILMDDGDTSAWKNETGYTGSTISFPKLSGSGTFESPKTATEVNQVFRFGDVTDFTGAFKIGSKKLLLGSGGSTTGAKTGSFTFANGVKVRSGLDWRGVTAYFGKTLGVYGATNDVLLTYSGEAPSVSGVQVELYGAGWVTTNMLLAAEGKITVVGIDALVDGTPVTASGFADVLKSGREIEIPVGSAVSVVDGRTVINGQYYIPSVYKLTKLSTSSTKYCVSLDEREVTPSLADFTLNADSGKIVIRVTNAKPGLKYGLRTVSSLAESFDDAEVFWLEAKDDTVTFEVDTSDASGFYQVIVTD